jgi:alginate O-acetyltransferase complex protein AlgI
MIFSSYIFVLAFLPITVLGYWLLQRKKGLEWSMAWLTGCSLFYYGWWNPIYLLLIGMLMLVNYGLGLAIYQRRFAPRLLMIAGVTFNLAVLGYFKYMDFFISTINGVADTNYHLLHIILPLGISFFTFQKIAFLVDSYHRKIEQYSFLHYCLFVTFFPAADCWAYRALPRIDAGVFAHSPERPDISPLGGGAVYFCDRLVQEVGHC